MAVTVSEVAMGEYGVWFMDESKIPWENWAGHHQHGEGPYNIYNGDDPIGNFVRKVRCQNND